jgi:hypothetical protein
MLSSPTVIRSSYRQTLELTPKLLDNGALRIERRTAEQGHKRWTKIDVTNGPLDHLRPVDRGSKGHHPGIAGGIVVGAVIEKAVGR